MLRFCASFLLAFFAFSSPAQDVDPDRSKALQSLTADDDAKRAVAATWIAQHGKQTDAELLVQHLTDESPLVRTIAEQGLWVLWSHSGDAAVDAMLAKGAKEMSDGNLEASIATFSAVITRRPDFAEGWNKRATALFLIGDLRRSLADCDEVMKRNPYHFGALAGYGQIYFKLEQYAKAIDYWKRALRVNPNMRSVEASIESAEVLLERKQKGSI